MQHINLTRSQPQLFPYTTVWGVTNHAAWFKNGLPGSCMQAALALHVRNRVVPHNNNIILPQNNRLPACHSTAIVHGTRLVANIVC